MGTIVWRNLVEGASPSHTGLQSRPALWNSIQQLTWHTHYTQMENVPKVAPDIARAAGQTRSMCKASECGRCKNRITVH